MQVLSGNLLYIFFLSFSSNVYVGWNPLFRGTKQKRNFFFLEKCNIVIFVNGIPQKGKEQKENFKQMEEIQICCKFLDASGK